MEFACKMRVNIIQQYNILTFFANNNAKFGQINKPIYYKCYANY